MVETNKNICLYNACGHDHIELAKLMLENGAHNMDKGFYGACLSGSKECFDLCIKEGVSDCQGGLNGLVGMAIQKIIAKVMQMMDDRGDQETIEGFQGACIVIFNLP
jgi:hypothetical protein